MSGQMAPLDFVLPSEATMIAADAAGVTADPQLGTLITYRHFTGRTFTPSTGLYTPSFTDQVLYAIRNELSVSEVAASGGVYKAGDVRWLITRATLLVEPGQDDQIVVADGSIFDMIRWATDPVGAFWRVVMRQTK